MHVQLATLCVGLRLLPLDDSLPNVRCCLLHRVELPVSRHFRVILSVLVHQSLYPLLLPLALPAWCLLCAVHGSLFEFPDDWVLGLGFCSLWYHGKAVPLHVLVVILDLVERVVQRVVLLLECACYAEDSACLGVALDFDLLVWNVLRLLGF
jgi:hypothetical protein